MIDMECRVTNKREKVGLTTIGKKKKLLSPSESSISYNEILGSIDAQV